MSEMENQFLAQKEKAYLWAKVSFWFAITGFLSSVYVLNIMIILDNFALNNIIGSVLFFTSLFANFLAVSVILGFVFGLVSIFKIKRSKGQLKDVPGAKRGIIVSAITFFIVWPFTGYLQIKDDPVLINRRNLASLGKAMKMYMMEDNGKYPTSTKWCDLLISKKIITEKQLCYYHKNGKKRCNLAINPNCEPNSPKDVVLLFESKDGWNQVGGSELIKQETGERWVLFNDCNTIKPVEVKDFGKLKWKD